MTEQPSAPLVPPEVDLRDFRDFPLDFKRLFASDTWIMCNAEEKVAALRLWCFSMHQEPAGSLPDNDRILADLAGYGVAVREFLKVKENAMRGWQRCADGRLYHPVVAEKMLDCWSKKRRKEIENAADRERKRRKKEALSARTAAAVPPENPEIPPGTPAGIPPDEPTAPPEPADGIPAGNRLKEKKKGDDSVSSLRSETGAPSAPLSPAELQQQLWASGKKFLTDRGVNLKQAGSLIGKWLKQIGPPDAHAVLLRILASAQVNCYGDAIEYIEATIRRRNDDPLAIPAFLDRRSPAARAADVRRRGREGLAAAFADQLHGGLDEPPADRAEGIGGADRQDAHGDGAGGVVEASR